MIADELREAENTYPAPWIEEAIKLAVTNNVRRWKYIAAILERWRQEGKQDATNRRDSQRELQRQIPDDLKDIIQR
jgi:DNA replication protein DnaD